MVLKGLTVTPETPSVPRGAPCSDLPGLAVGSALSQPLDTEWTGVGPLEKIRVLLAGKGRVNIAFAETRVHLKQPLWSSPCWHGG